MTFDTDMKIAEGVLAEMQGRFDVANPMGFPAKPTDGDRWQMETRSKIAGSDNIVVYRKVPIDATFYKAYGAHIADQIKNDKKKTNLKCFDFNAYILARLIDKGFEGPITKGLLGISTLAGHEFLLLYWDCAAQYQRILDLWSHLQTGKPALCAPADFNELLPAGLRDTLAKKGIDKKAELKSGPCPT